MYNSNNQIKEIANYDVKNTLFIPKKSVKLKPIDKNLISSNINYISNYNTNILSKKAKLSNICKLRQDKCLIFFKNINAKKKRLCPLSLNNNNILEESSFFNKFDKNKINYKFNSTFGVNQNIYKNYKKLNEIDICLYKYESIKMNINDRYLFYDNKNSFFKVFSIINKIVLNKLKLKLLNKLFYSNFCKKKYKIHENLCYRLFSTKLIKNSKILYFYIFNKLFYYLKKIVKIQSFIKIFLAKKYINKLKLSKCVILKKFKKYLNLKKIKLIIIIQKHCRGL